MHKIRKIVCVDILFICRMRKSKVGIEINIGWSFKGLLTRSECLVLR